MNQRKKGNSKVGVLNGRMVGFVPEGQLERRDNNPEQSEGKT